MTGFWKTVLLGCLVIRGAGDAAPASSTSPQAPAEQTLRLPPPTTRGGMALTEALSRRRSVRRFVDAPLSTDHVAQLCWAAQGVTQASRGFRAAPSAGALYPISVFLVTADGVFEYGAGEHALRPHADGDRRSGLQAAALGQPCIGAAPLVMVITAAPERSAQKYGRRAERYCLLEAGHVAQNVLLQATALGLGGVSIGAFQDARVADVLELPPRLRPLYLLPLGEPRS